MQLSHMSRVPELLVDILESRDYIKFGVSIEDDAQQLREHYGAPVRSWIDLALIFEAYGYGKRLGLKTMSESLIDSDVHDRLFFMFHQHWNDRPLAPIMVRYAAMDAVVAIKVFEILWKHFFKNQPLLECLEPYLEKNRLDATRLPADADDIPPLPTLTPKNADEPKPNKGKQIKDYYTWLQKDRGARSRDHRSAEHFVDMTNDVVPIPAKVPLIQKRKREEGQDESPHKKQKIEALEENESKKKHSRFKEWKLERKQRRKERKKLGLVEEEVVDTPDEVDRAEAKRIKKSKHKEKSH
eukprot:Colp12_sorted_trinity150504_noHs@14110